VLRKRITHLLSGRSRGQGLVEFALVIPLFMLVVVGIIEFGFFFFVYSSVNTAAREASRYGAGAANSEYGVPYYQDCQGIRNAAKRIGTYSGLTDDQIQIGYDSGPETNQDWTQCLPGTLASGVNSTLGDRVVVRITVAYKPIVSMLGFPSIDVTGVSARTILRELEIEGTPLASPTSEAGEDTPTATEVGADTPTPTNTLLNTPTKTPTPTATPKKNDKTAVPTVCLTPIELGGCE
jgi:Flp pilus assembly protein TadG